MVYRFSGYSWVAPFVVLVCLSTNRRKLYPMTIKILEHLWILFIGVGGWCVNQLMGKISDLDKGKASADDVSDVKRAISNLDRRVDDIDHATQLRLVPREEYKSDIRLLFSKVAEVSEKLCEKEDRIKTIRVRSDDKEE